MFGLLGLSRKGHCILTVCGSILIDLPVNGPKEKHY